LVNATLAVDAPTAGAATPQASRAVTGTPGLATTPAASPWARMISVRHEVSGPIEVVDAGSGALVIAGQRVTVRHAAWGAGRPSVGDWVSVSGLRQVDGTLEASRLDRAPVGTLMVRGRVSRSSGTLRIGSLVLSGPTAATATPGQFVTIEGRYRAGAAEVTSVAPDRLRTDPAGYFGDAVNGLIVQGFVRVGHGMVWLDDGPGIPAGPGVRAVSGAYRDAVVSLRRGADGGLTATSLRYADDRDVSAGALPGTEAGTRASLAVPRAAPRVKPAARGGGDGTVWDSAPERPPARSATPTPTIGTPAPLSPAPPPVATTPVPPPLPVSVPPVATHPKATLPGVTASPPDTPTPQGHDPAPVAMIPSRNPKRLPGPGPKGDRATVAAGAGTTPLSRLEASSAGAGTASASDRRATPPAVFTAASTVAPAAPTATAGTPEATGVPPHQR